MADIADVEGALVAAAAAALYPNGTSAPSTVGAPVRIYRGWPSVDALQADLDKGICHVSIYSRPGVNSIERRGFQRWAPGDRPDPSMSATVDAAAGTVTFAGTGAAPQMIAVVGTGPGQVFTRRIDPADTPETLAAGFASDIEDTREASAARAVLTVPGARLAAGVLAGGSARRVLRDQRQGMSVIAWCPTPALRDAVAPLLDEALFTNTRMSLPDGNMARLVYTGTASDDGERARPIYRRDLLLTAEFPSHVEAEFPPVVAIPIGSPSGPDAPTPEPGEVPIRRVVISVTPEN